MLANNANINVFTQKNTIGNYSHARIHKVIIKIVWGWPCIYLPLLLKAIINVHYISMYCLIITNYLL